MNDMFFFFFDIEKRIGLKKLSGVELGTSESSNQTHIGLFEDVLQFLGDNVVTTAMLVYGDYCQILDCYFDRIKNPDGTYRSPKYEKGELVKNPLSQKLESLPWKIRVQIGISFGLD